VATENGSMSYENINKILTLIELHAKSPYVGLTATLEVEDEDLSMDDIELSLVHKGNVIKRLSPDMDGSVQFELLDHDVGEDALVVINQPKGKVAMRLAAGVKPVRSQQVPYDELFSVLDDLENIANEMIGLPSWLLPDLDYLEFSFGSQAVITLVGADVITAYESNSEHVIKIERQADLKHSNAKVVFSQLPTEVRFLQ
jgi:hypothetical protein